MALRRSFPLLLVALSPLCRADEAVAEAETFSTASADSVTTDANTVANSGGYDYVIVGGGTAGMALASRLSEVSWISVAVIDAGTFMPNDDLLNIPKNFGRATGQATYDWMYVSAPQTNAAGRGIAQPRGKVLGGSSAINFEIFNRGHKDEYDAWETISDGQQWDWNSLFPYFKKVENYTPPSASVNTLFSKREADHDSQFLARTTSSSVPAGYGTGGYVQVSNNEWYSSLAPDFLKTMKSLNVQINRDPAGGNNVGLYNSGSSVDRRPGKGVRSYAGVNYPHDRPNLKILTGAQATKILFGGKVRSKQVASGVQYQTKQGTFTINANKEVILCAGVFQSPALLELSGIGQTAVLQKQNIATLIELPGVGENLQDHPMLTSSFILKDGEETWDKLRLDATFAAQASALYNSSRSGILTSTIGILSFLPLPSFLSSSTAAALIKLANAIVPTTPLQTKQFEIQNGWLKDGKVPQLELVFAPTYLPSSWGQPAAAGKSYLSISAGIQHPFARGTVHIVSPDPVVKPAIDMKFLSTTYDMNMAIESLKYARKIAQTPPLSDHIAAFQDPLQNVTSDEDYSKYAARTVESLKHPVGTCALAPLDMGGVVDTRLIVYGTTNLRIADASIIPLHISAHTQATTYGIAEKAAGMIKYSLGVDN